MSTPPLVTYGQTQLDWRSVRDAVMDQMGADGLKALDHIVRMAWANGYDAGARKGPDDHNAVFEALGLEH